MNIDKKKLTRSIVIIVLLFAFVTIATRFAKSRDYTLSDYATDNSGVAMKEEKSEEDEEAYENMEDNTKNVFNNSEATGFIEEISSPEEPVSLTGEVLMQCELLKYPEHDFSDGFYFLQLSDKLKDYITGITYPSDEQNDISYDDLFYLHVKYYDFEGKVKSGELICNRAIAQDLLDIFYELYENEYQIDKIRLIDEYNADDDASCLDDNTSCFNYRCVPSGKSLSKHALGLAVDINPFYNPYVTYDETGCEIINTPGSEVYADRSKDFAYKIDENDLAYKLFTGHGFTWGGSWNSCKDYQHFQKSLQ